MAVKKVLCVDDVKADLMNIEKMVAGTGVLVVTASSGLEAIAKANSEQPDLIFLDINMPDMDGFATIRELKKIIETKSIPVIFVSSKDQKADKIWAQMQGAIGYVTKPYTQEQIIEKLKSV